MFSEQTMRIEEAARKRFEPVSRIPHIFGCADTAISLALIYGVDPDEAAQAALLHDWDKVLTKEEIIARATELNLDEDATSPGVLPALHSFTGAVDVHKAFPDVSMDVISAISKHTVASVSMSPLDSILYIADLIEPSRTFEEVDSVREAVGNVSLDTLMFIAYKFNLSHLVKEGKPLYPKTVEIYNALLGGGHSNEEAN